MSYAKHISSKTTPQQYPIPNRSAEMEEMASGGYGFTLGSMECLRRFLILGSAGGTYYASERDLTVENASSINNAFAEHGKFAVDEIVKVSHYGIAPKNKPALFALAMAFSFDGSNKKDVRYAANLALPQVARTASDLLYFVSQVNELRGWGRGLRTAVADWFQNMDVEKLAYQAVKYKQRDGWSLRDLLRLSHPKSNDSVQNAVYQYIVKGAIGVDIQKQTPQIIISAEKIKNTLADEGAYEIRNNNIPREAVPTELLSNKAIWEALLMNMPLTAMVRNLGKMTSIGVLAPLNGDTVSIGRRLTHQEHIKKSRLHPFTILTALKQYVAGKGDKGSLTWNPINSICEALDSAFMLAFKNVKPTNKKILIGLDVSGSMSRCVVDGLGGIAASQAAGILGMVMAETEKEYHIIGFDTDVRTVPILTGKSSAFSVLEEWQRVSGGGTDCSIPVKYAIKNRIITDAIVIITDEESWFGDNHLTQAFDKYKKVVNPDAKLVIICTTATRTTIADPKDPQQLSIIGFDAGAFEVMNAFIRGDV